MDEKTYEIIAFSLVAAKILISLIMVILNWNNPLFNISKTSKKSSTSKKSKPFLNKTTEMIENYIKNICSLLKNNKFVWSISLVVCVVVCVLLGLSIWGDNKKEEEITTAKNK